MKKILLVALFALCNVAFVNAKAVNIPIHTSCGDVYVVCEIGDTVTAADIAEFAKRIELVFCG